MKIIFRLLPLLLLFVFSNVLSHPFDYEIKTVNYKNLVAKLYLPKTDDKVPAVIAFGGSDPGWGFADANGHMMATHGIAVIGLVYFNMDPRLPATLDQIPMEYFIDAIDYAATVGQIDQQRLGVVSGSRGAEAGFLLAILDQRIRSVAITTPSKVAWGGVTSSRSAWTYRGSDIASLTLPDAPSLTQLQRFQASLADSDKVKRAMFAFEKIRAPMLLISATEDQVWPSTAMTNDIVQYLKDKKYSFPVVHRSYPTGHAFSRETAPEIKQMIIDHFVRTLGH